MVSANHASSNSAQGGKVSVLYCDVTEVELHQKKKKTFQKEDRTLQTPIQIFTQLLFGISSKIKVMRNPSTKRQSCYDSIIYQPASLQICSAYRQTSFPGIGKPPLSIYKGKVLGTRMHKSTSEIVKVLE